MSEITTVTSDLVKEITELLTANKFKEAISALTDNKYSAFLKDNSWDLIPVITKHLNKETNTSSPELYDCCEELLQIVAEKSHPEEALLEFIEQAELAKEDFKFHSILKALQKTLLKLTSKRGRSLEWSLNTIQSHINELPAPGEHNLENDEKLLLDGDDNVQRITIFYSELLPFYKPFINEVALPNLDRERKKRKDLLACYLLQLLGKPLASLDLEVDLKPKNRARVCAERIMSYLSDLVGDCYKFLDYVTENRKATDDDPILDVFACEERTPTLSLGVYYYLLLSENIQNTQIPQVYDALYLFQNLFHLVGDLLQHTEQFITRKGLLLAHALICSDLLQQLPYKALDSSAHCIFCKNLTNIIIYSDVKTNRELAIKIFKTYIFKFDLKGRYLLITNLMRTVKHVNTRGYLIAQYKDMIREAFTDDENKIPEYFSGYKLFKLINVFCLLPDGSESDLMELGDQIITTLNLLTYLALRDKYNATNIWNHFKTMETTFFKPLKEGLIISKAHYELKMKELKDEEGSGDSKVEVMVGPHQIPALPFEDKMAVLLSAMNSFGALEMLLARLEEIIDDGPDVDV